MSQFQLWNPLKIQIDTFAPVFHVHEREIWYTYLWANIGYEQDWKWDKFVRPVLVIKKVGNIFFVVPMTTKWKETLFYHTLSNIYFEQQSRLILSQCKMIDKKRFIDKIGMISKQEFLIVKEKLKELLL